MTFQIRSDQMERDPLLESAGVSRDAPWEVVARLLASRYSCRGFRPDPLPHETIERLLSLAQLSASWCNSQPWQVIVTEGRGTDRFRDAVSAHAEANWDDVGPDIPFPARYAGIYKNRRLETAGQLYDCVGVQFGDRAASRRQTLENFKLFGAPHVLLVTTEHDLGSYGAIDCGIYLANLMLLAEGMGIATIPQAALAMFSPFIRDYFGLPPNRLVVCGMSIGHCDEEHPANKFRTCRAPSSEVVSWHND